MMCRAWTSSSSTALRSGWLPLAALLLVGAANPPYCGPSVFRSPALWPFGASRAHDAHCRIYDVRAPRALLSVAVATNQQDRERGLMFVRVLPAHVGMIFTFADGDNARVFWMKNTLIPLDMVFIRGDGTVTGIAEHVPATTPQTPDQQIPRRAGVGRYVIELNAGEAARDGITIGGRLALPALGAM